MATASARPDMAGTRSPQALRQQLKALPNVLTFLRLFLCFLFFAVLIYCSIVLKLPVDAEGELSWWRLRGDLLHEHAGLRSEESYLTFLLNAAFVVFVLAGATDIADGKIARAYKLETDVGRIADPFVDKIMILGSFTLLMPLTVHVMGWMVILVLARELLVSAIRGFAESRGIPFPATFWGKTKMATQSACVAASMLYIGHPSNTTIRWIFLALLWLALASTVISGVVYLAHAKRLLFEEPGEKALFGTSSVAPPSAAPPVEGQQAVTERPA